MNDDRRRSSFCYHLALLSSRLVMWQLAVGHGSNENE
jgi:hypothetical protein